MGKLAAFDWSSHNQEYGARGRLNRSTFSINIRTVTDYTKQFVPHFREVGFAFRDLSKFSTFTSITSKYRNLSKYYFKMIQRLHDLADDTLIDRTEISRCSVTKEENDMLSELCKDFAASNDKRMISDIENAALIKVSADGISGDGTPLHFDRQPGIHYPVDSGYILRVWIPLSDIDNYVLTVGDSRSYFKEEGDGGCCDDDAVGNHIMNNKNIETLYFINNT